MKEKLSQEEIDAHKVDENCAAVYCGTYHKYNCGNLFGMWIDLESFTDADDFFEFCSRLHCDEEDPEFMFLDYENFPKKFYGESMCRDECQELLDYLRDHDEYQREIIEEYWDECESSADPDDILERLVYEGDFDKYAESVADEMLEQSNIPDNFKSYFDYDSFARDLKYDYSVTSNYVFL